MCYLLDNRELAQKGFFSFFWERVLYRKGGGEISSIISFLLYTIVCISFSVWCRKSNQPSLYTCSILLSGTKKSKKKKKKEKNRVWNFPFGFWCCCYECGAKESRRAYSAPSFFLIVTHAMYIYIYIYYIQQQNNELWFPFFRFLSIFNRLDGMLLPGSFSVFSTFFFYFFGVLGFLWWFGCPYRPIIRY